MGLYYTTVAGENSEQPDVNKSFGGYKSSTVVTNDDFGNLFDEISIMSIRNGRDEYRALVFKNETEQTLRKVAVTMNIPEGGFCSYKLAVTRMTKVDEYGQAYMERTASGYSKPMSVKFVEMPGNAIEVGEMKADEMIGIWVCRHIDKEEAKRQYNDVCQPDPEDPLGRRYIPVTHATEEVADIEISYRGA